MSPAKKKKQYIVANPRDIPAGLPVFRQGDREWYEGDTYDGDAPKELLRRGFIKEVS